MGKADSLTDTFDSVQYCQPSRKGPLAQLAEQATLNRQVIGSIPMRVIKRGEISQGFPAFAYMLNHPYSLFKKSIVSIVLM
jgi:hypothetical protein